MCRNSLLVRFGGCHSVLLVTGEEHEALELGDQHSVLVDFD